MRRRPTPARSRAPAASGSRCSARATSSTRRGRSARSSSAAAPTTSGRATRAFRAVLDGLLGGVEMRRFPRGLDTPIAPLSGGERRRIALAQLLLDGPELLLLDEPTNHLDVEGVDWLARHLAARRGAMLVVTHDRWFLDAVCTTTWEVADEAVHQYEGGYAAYVLARAERERQSAAREDRRQGLLRKELAWLRRGPPARTSKPKFRIEAANALIADEPEVRDRAELLRFAAARLGDRVLDAVGRVRRLRRAGDPARRDLAARPGRARRRSSASTARARRRWCGCSPGSWRPPTASSSVAPTVRLALALAGHGGDPGAPARARVARGRARARDARRRAGDHRRAALRPLRLPRRQGAHARARPLRRGAAAAPAHAAAHGRAERAAARRADERPRHRHPRRARGPARRLAGHAGRGQPRPLLRRARVRRRARADGRRAAAPPARRHRAVPRAAPRRRGGPGRRGRPPGQAGGPRRRGAARRAEGGAARRARARAPRRARGGAARGDGGERHRPRAAARAAGRAGGGRRRARRARGRLARRVRDA